MPLQFAENVPLCLRAVAVSISGFPLLASCIFARTGVGQALDGQVWLTLGLQASFHISL